MPTFHPEVISEREAFPLRELKSFGWTAVTASIVVVIAGLWSVAAMMIVFEDVDGISRLKAFGLSCVLGFFFQVMVRALFTVQ